MYISQEGFEEKEIISSLAKCYIITLLEKITLFLFLANLKKFITNRVIIDSKIYKKLLFY